MNDADPRGSRAHWYKGDQARAIHVRLHPDPSGALLVEPEDGEGFYPDWSLEETHGGGFFRIRISGDHDGFLEGQDAALEGWLRMHSGRGGRRGVWTRILAWSGALAALLAVLYLVVLPFATGAALRYMPRSWDVRVGRSVWPAMSQDVVVPEGEVAKAIGRGQAFLDSLAVGTGITFKLHWAPDSETVNAFALPSGDIVLYQGIVRKMKSPDELLGVLAHEAGHVVERHGMNAVTRAAILGLIAGAATGDAGGGISVLLGHAALLESLSYGRKHEASADAFAVKALAASGQPCGGLESLFTRGLGESGPSWIEYSSTHPADARRAEALAALRRKVPGCDGPGKPFLRAKDLKALQGP